METTDYLNVNWPGQAKTESKTTQNEDRLIERTDGGRSYVAPTTKLNSRGMKNDIRLTKKSD